MKNKGYNLDQYKILNQLNRDKEYIILCSGLNFSTIVGVVSRMVGIQYKLSQSKFTYSSVS